ncbi:threonine dehydratase [Streptococcus pneumoniae]|uniref:hypothetical protein n=1 Tax=Streptococcus pneumoniae TaxID=1313 RepID=UPI000778A4CB|nr:hypothetical protein [Streptococcus pneumoniae]KYA81214.1 threonine dehydratase [Streptococcus pneumoniae]
MQKNLSEPCFRAFCRALKSSPNHQIEIRNSLDKTIDFSYSLSFFYLPLYHTFSVYGSSL